MFIGIHKVVIQDEQACNHSLSRYYAMWNQPRPESSTLVCPASAKQSIVGKQSASVIFLTSYACQDKELASKILSVSEKQQFYREVGSTAETGWDFSTRWMR